MYILNRVPSKAVPKTPFEIWICSSVSFHFWHKHLLLPVNVVLFRKQFSILGVRLAINPFSSYAHNSAHSETERERQLFKVPANSSSEASSVYSGTLLIWEGFSTLCLFISCPCATVLGSCHIGLCWSVFVGCFPLAIERDWSLLLDRFS